MAKGCYFLQITHRPNRSHPRKRGVIDLRGNSWTNLKDAKRGFAKQVQIPSNPIRTMRLVREKDKDDRKQGVEVIESFQEVPYKKLPVRNAGRLGLR